MASLQIIIPAYNAAEFVEQTLDSVLSQGVVVDILVLDNASTDATAAVVARYADRGVRCITNASNIGSPCNHNLGLSLATADYLKLLSADDVLLPGVLAAQVKALDDHPEVGLVTCNCIVTDAQLNPMHETTYLPGYQPGKLAVAHCVAKVANLVGAPSNTMLRMACLGGLSLDPTLKWLGDLDFACQVLARADYFNIDVPGFLYRRHDATDSIISAPSLVRLRDEFLFVRKYKGGAMPKARIAWRAIRACTRSFLAATHRPQATLTA